MLIIKYRVYNTEVQVFFEQNNSWQWKRRMMTKYLVRVVRAFVIYLSVLKRAR